MSTGAFKVIDTNNGTILTTIPETANRDLAVHPSGDRVYALAGVLLPGPFNALSRIDTATSAATTIPMTCQPLDIAINPAGTRAYVTCFPFSAPPELRVFDLGSDTEIATVNLSFYPSGVAVTPDNAFVYVPDLFDDSVSIIDAGTNTIVGSPIPVGDEPVAHGDFVGPAFVCGNGLVNPDEGCDDGDTESDDGCSASCAVEPGWSCSPASPTVCVPICGDGLVVGPEACDDGPANGTDACCTGTCTVVDGDLDGTCDRDDPCPHLGGAAPDSLTSVRKLTLRYKRTGPGGNDDGVRLNEAVFTSGATFDLDTTDTLHVTLANTGTGGRLVSFSLAAGGFWTQRSPDRRKWTYRDRTLPVPVAGVRRARLAEAPGGPGVFQLKLSGKGTSISAAHAPLDTVTDDVRVTVEIEAGGTGVCVATTLGGCETARPDVDLCVP
jgi:cysteine-rich repeat protein/YVTN family beta-propeller protein